MSIVLAGQTHSFIVNPHELSWSLFEFTLVQHLIIDSFRMTRNLLSSSLTLNTNMLLRSCATCETLLQKYFSAELTFTHSLFLFFLFISHSDPPQIADNNFVDSIKLTDRQKRLLSAAKELAAATARMVEAAKMCANRPTDRESQVRAHFFRVLVS